MAAGDETVGGEGDVAVLAADAVVPLLEGKGRREQAPLQDLHQPEAEPGFRRAPHDRPPWAMLDGGQRLDAQALAAHAKLATGVHRALGSDADEHAVPSTYV